MKLNIKNKKVIIIAIATSIILSIVGLFLSNRGYKAEDRQANLGVEEFMSTVENSGEDVVNVTAEVITSLKDFKADAIVDEYPNITQKENDDIIYGTINYSREIFKSVDSLTEEEFMKKLKLEEADTDDIADFKTKVSPILKEMAELEDEILNKDFNGHVSKAHSDKFNKLNDEYNVYFSRYMDKAWDYYMENEL